MLKRFSVINFKNFDQRAVFELDNPSNYEFNDEVVQNGCITKGIVYGINGSGKSNLALALFDIVLHLTDKEKAFDKYAVYLNLSSNKPIAEFEYVFVFDGIEVIYRYGKKDAMTLDYETLDIDGNEVVSYDYNTGRGYTILKGAETLQLSSELQAGTEKLSRVKFIKSNAILENNAINKAFVSFTSFVDNMLMFYSLDSNRYQGLNIGGGSYTQGIIRHGKIKEFERFLHEQGIDYHLVSLDINGTDDIFCQFPRQTVPFNMVASTGTKSLALFYYWYTVMPKASFVFIDEYDAFYHFELSQELVRLVRSLVGTQVFMTTHNTDLLSNELLRPDAYFIIENNVIGSLDKKTDKELRRAHNLQKMYKAGSFNEKTCEMLYR
ncbi:MAG: ATP-binding protein [Clostridia bacterium]|nr:ATP-binding protein [Clostridia bacterium]